MTEDELQAAIIELAHYHGWRVAHFRPALTKQGWRTPVSADGAGFPDLIMVRDKRLIVAELKGPRGKVSAAQDAWLRAFGGVPGLEVMVIRADSTLDEVEKLLT